MRQNALKNPFAQIDGATIHVDQAEQGREPYTCPGCSGPLHYVRESKPHARTGNRRRPHFAHANADCAHGLETGLHLWAKALISKERKLTAPDYYVTHLGRRYAFPAPIEIADVQVEPWEGGIRPDLKIIDPLGNETHVEICVTHAVDLDKEDILLERNTSCLEIDLSELDLDTLDEDALARAILHSAPRTWIHHQDIAEFEQAARAHWEADTRCYAAMMAENASTEPPPASPLDERVLDDLIADYGLEPFIGRELGLAEWFSLSTRHWQARVLKDLVIDRIAHQGDLPIVPAQRFTIRDERRDPELLSLVQPWPRQRSDIDASDPYILQAIELHHPNIGSPPMLVRRYIDQLIAEPDRPGHPAGRRIIDRARSRPGYYRIYRPWADYVLRKQELLRAFLKAGRRRPLKENDFRAWYPRALASGQSPRKITAAGGPEYLRLLARVDAVTNMVNGGWPVEDLMGIEEPGFRNQQRRRPGPPHPTGMFKEPNGDTFYPCNSMETFRQQGGDVQATLKGIAARRLGAGVHAYLAEACDELGGLTPIEFAGDVPTMQKAIELLPPSPGAQGRKRLW